MAQRAADAWWEILKEFSVEKQSSAWVYLQALLCSQSAKQEASKKWISLFNGNTNYF